MFPASNPAGLFNTKGIFIMNNEKFNALCKKIEKSINNALPYLWGADVLADIKRKFFKEYSGSEYTVVYYDAEYVSHYAEDCLLDRTRPIGLVAADFEPLRQELTECTPEQLKSLEKLYNLHVGDRILGYFYVPGCYAIVREEDYDPDVFDCSPLPYPENSDD